MLATWSMIRVVVDECNVATVDVERYFSRMRLFLSSSAELLLSLEWCCQGMRLLPLRILAWAKEEKAVYSTALMFSDRRLPKEWQYEMSTAVWNVDISSGAAVMNFGPGFRHCRRRSYYQARKATWLIRRLIPFPRDRQLEVRNGRRDTQPTSGQLHATRNLHNFDCTKIAKQINGSLKGHGRCHPSNRLRGHYRGWVFSFQMKNIQ